MSQETHNSKPSTHGSLSRLRARLQATREDARGIALQTIIIIVVLLAIAGGVSAALLTRAQDATTQLEQQSVSVDLGNIKTKAFCDSSGYHWKGPAASGKCQIAAYVAGTHEPLSPADCARNGFTYNSGDSKCEDP